MVHVAFHSIVSGNNLNPQESAKLNTLSAAATSRHFTIFLLQPNGDCTLQFILLQLAGFYPVEKIYFQKNLR